MKAASKSDTLWSDCGSGGPAFRWDEERWILVRRELDAAFFHLYGIGEEDAAYLCDTLSLVRHKDEDKCNGDYESARQSRNLRGAGSVQTNLAAVR